MRGAAPHMERPELKEQWVLAEALPCPSLLPGRGSSLPAVCFGGKAAAAKSSCQVVPLLPIRHR